METNTGRTRKEPINRQQKIIMLATLIRVAKSFRMAKLTLTPEHFFHEEDLALSLVWRATLEFYEEHQQLPAEAQLLSQVQVIVDRLGSVIEEEDFDELGDIMYIVFDLQEDDLKTVVARKLMQRLMNEALHNSTRLQLELGNAEDLPALLRETLKQAERISTLEITTIPNPFEGGLNTLTPIVTRSTGIPFLDGYMAGGAANGEVYGFCGPYGSCKTTLAVMLAVERAISEQKKWIDGGKKEPLPLVYLVAWEEEMSSLRLRAVSYSARISRKSMEGIDYKEKLSTTGNLKDYEKRLFFSQLQNGIEVKGEKERADLWMRRLGRNLRFIDFTGAEPSYSEAAGNMSDGVVDIIQTDQENQGSPGVSCVVLDYAGAAAIRALGHRGLTPEHNLRHFIGKMPLNLKNKVAIPFDCPVWVFHQLGTQANSKSSATVPRMTDAAESRSFFENLNFGFMVGVPTNKSYCVFTAAKQRRTERRPDRILYIDGDLCRVRDTNGRYMIHNNRIVQSEDYMKVADNIPDTGRPSSGDRSMFADIGIK